MEKRQPNKSEIKSSHLYYCDYKRIKTGRGDFASRHGLLFASTLVNVWVAVGPQPTGLGDETGSGHHKPQEMLGVKTAIYQAWESTEARKTQILENKTWQVARC